MEQIAFHLCSSALILSVGERCSIFWTYSISIICARLSMQFNFIKFTVHNAFSYKVTIWWMLTRKIWFSIQVKWCALPNYAYWINYLRVNDGTEPKTLIRRTLLHFRITIISFYRLLEIEFHCTHWYNVCEWKILETASNMNWL